jgi:hypothetical protein
MSGSDAPARRRGFPVAATLLVIQATYIGAYCYCARRPTPVAFHSMEWPYYAVGPHGWWRQGEYRLPEAAAELFFYPANWVDRRLYPKKWGDKRWSLAFHEYSAAS